MNQGELDEPTGLPIGISHNAHTRPLCQNPAYMSYPPMELSASKEMSDFAQATTIQAEMILADLKSKDFAQARSNANFPLRKRRPELYGELIRPVTQA